jgi:hypothetical protein
MHFSTSHRAKASNNDRSTSLKPDADVGLSCLYRSNKAHARLSQSAFPTYYSLAYLPMPYLPKNNTRSMQSNIQILIYNFLERPSGLKCFFYHFFV